MQNVLELGHKKNAAVGNHGATCATPQNNIQIGNLLRPHVVAPKDYDNNKKSLFWRFFLTTHTPTYNIKDMFQCIKNLFQQSVCIRIQAGLGNTMFQYATAYAYAKKHNKRLLLYDHPEELVSTFNINNKIISTPPKRHIFDENKGANHFRDFVNTDNFKFLNGYFQDGQVFEEYSDDLLNIFRFKKPLTGANAYFAHQIQNTNSVSIHVRRTDYLLEFPNSVLPPEYYLSAIEYIASRIKNPHFYIFSDQLRWVEANIKIKYPHTYITSNRSWQTAPHDMHLMSLCKHNIIANSSFSWWGAWLNTNPNKLIIAPSTWIIDSAQHINTTKYIVPDSWIRIPSGINVDSVS